MAVTGKAKFNIVLVLGGLLALALYFPYLWFGVTPFGSDEEWTPEQIAELTAGKAIPDYYAQPLPEITDQQLMEQKAAFQWCRFCHTLDQEGHNRVGPNLHKIYGQPAGVVDHFAYSDSFIELRESGHIWTPENMVGFIGDPHSMVPGNRMRYPPMIGYEMCDKRDQLIVDYMRRMTAPGAPSDMDIPVLEPAEGEAPFDPCA